MCYESQAWCACHIGGSAKFFLVCLDSCDVQRFREIVRHASDVPRATVTRLEQLCTRTERAFDDWKLRDDVHTVLFRVEGVVGRRSIAEQRLLARMYDVTARAARALLVQEELTAYELSLLYAPFEGLIPLSSLSTHI